MEGDLHFSSVSPPLNTTVPCPALNVEDLKAIVKCRSKVKDHQPEMAELTKTLQDESKLLDAFLYKNHNRFRNDKGYRTAKMLDKTLKKLLDLPYLEKLTDFLQFVPSHQQTTRLPTVAMSHYCQVLLTIAAKFLLKIDHLSRKSGLLNMQRLNLGHFWGFAALSLAVISRIWILCRNLLCKLEVCYSNLGKMNQFLPGVPLGYLLPEYLSQLLDDELRNFVENYLKSESLKHSAHFGSNVLDVDAFLDLSEPVKRCLDVTDSFEGETSVKRSKVEADKSNPTTPVSEEKKDCLSDIHSIEDFKKFIIEESNLRKTCKKTSLTRKLSQSEWKMLKKEVLCNLNPVIPNKSIKLCRKMIRKSLKDRS